MNEYEILGGLHKIIDDDTNLKIKDSVTILLPFFLNMNKKTFHLFPNQVQMLLDLTINLMDFIWTVMGIKQEFINTIEKVIRSLLRPASRINKLTKSGHKKFYGMFTISFCIKYTFTCTCCSACLF